MHADFSDILRIMSEIMFDNAYEEDPSASFEQGLDVPLHVCISALGALSRGNLVLDISTGDTTAPVALANISSLPIANEVAEVTRSRFILSHLPDQEIRSQVVRDIFHTVSPAGKAVFIEHDWTKMRGSPVIEHFRDFALDNIPSFNVGTFEDEIAQCLHDYQVSIDAKRTSSPLVDDYRPILELQETIVKDLHRQNASRFVINEAVIILSALQTETSSTNPPGFLMPDVVAIIATKH